MKDELYSGYTEPEWKVQDRMNRRKLANVEAEYGEDWEDTASKLRAAVELADAQEFLTDSEVPADRAYRLEKAMNTEDPRTEWERDWDEHCAETLATREGDTPRGW